MNHLVIMAGGVGSRFWPLSDTARPKQFLDVLGCGKTLLQLTVERFEGLIPIENVWIVTSDIYADIVAEQLPQLPKNNILLEPCRKNTAPCVCYVSYKIKKRDPKGNIIVTPSDHFIANVEAFREVARKTLAFASETDSIVTMGIKPSYAETGYGYIKADFDLHSTRMPEFFRVDEFKEKPNYDTACEYVSQPNYFWNSGIFIWNVSTIVNAFRIYEPEMAKAFEALMPIFDTEEEQKAINELYPTLQSISVDYSILERSEEIFVFPSTFGWNDLGSWSSLLGQLPRDHYGNAKVGKEVDFYESKHCIVHAENLKKVVVQGLDGYVVAEKDGTLLICKLSEEQRIKLFHKN